MKPKIPVTVLTGFLGSGKTTLLNRILSEDHGLRVAVIENEFGEIGIDQDLVINADEEIFELNNGCICCNVRGDLIRILAELTDRINDFDLVILETTGMADPAPVAQTFLVQEDIQENYELDGVITLIDAKHVTAHLDKQTDEVLAQIAFADRIIINKVDLVSEAEKRILQTRLSSMNSMAGFYEATMANAPITDLLNIGGFNLERAMDIEPNFLEPEYPFESASLWQLPRGDYKLKMKEKGGNNHANQHGHYHHHDHHHNDAHDMSVVVTQCTSGSDLEQLAERVFVEFSSQPEVLERGQSLLSFDTHYKLNLEDRDSYTVDLSLPKDQWIALFSDISPYEIELEIISNSDEKQVPTAIKAFKSEHSHDNQVSSCSIQLPGAFDLVKLNLWLEKFLMENGPDLYRIKGVFAVDGQDYRFLFQGVHMIFSSQRGAEWGDHEPYNRLVLIGRNLDNAAILDSLEQCMSPKGTNRPSSSYQEAAVQRTR